MGKLEQIALKLGVNLEDELYRLYMTNKLGCTQVAKHFGVTSMTIHKYLKKFNIPRRDFREASRFYDKSGPKNPMYGKHLTEEVKRQKSEHLKQLIAERGHWCKGRKMSAEERALRSKSLTGANNPRWKGGRRLKTDGYVEIFDLNSPDNKKRHTTYEHRQVAEKMLGRKLHSSEVVHHINGKRNDNRPENLLILSAVEHSQLHGKLKIKHDRTYFCDPETWNKTNYDGCLKCKTKIIRHRGYGLCAKCYMQEKRANRLNKWKEGGLYADR